MRRSEFAIENSFLRYVISDRGRVLSFYEKTTGSECADPVDPGCFALLTVRPGGEAYPPSVVDEDDGGLKVRFETPDVTLYLSVLPRETDIVMKVVRVSGRFYSLSFGCANLVYKEAEHGPAACTLPLSMNTDTVELPGRSRKIGALCYASIGPEGAKAALLAAPADRLPELIRRTVVRMAPGDMPVSSAGGPFAAGARGSGGSYIIVSKCPTLSGLDELIEHYKMLNLDQVDYHQGDVFRQGDFVFRCPGGDEEFREISARLHAVGLQVGLHTYAQFIDPASRYVSPAPHPDLDALAFYTLAEDMDESSAAPVRVEEDVSQASTVTGFFVRNSVCLQIGSEIVTYGGAGAEGFTGITRGALGTAAAAHRRGEKVKHLSQFFHLFMPRLGSPLFFEIARNTAEVYNRMDFDMIYLDALDGTYSMCGDPNIAFYYCALFVNEIVKHTVKPPLMEYSCMPHGLWYARSRMGAMDMPTTGYRQFIDGHCRQNERNAHARYLSSQLGWISLYPPAAQRDDLPGFRTRYMFYDDIDYLGTRAVAYNSGLSYLGASPELVQNWPALRSNIERLGAYERARKAGLFGAEVRRQLREPGADFRLEQRGGKPCFVRVHVHKFKAADGDEHTLHNPFAAGAPRIRVEAMHTAADYDDPEGVTLLCINGDEPASGQACARVFEPMALPHGLGLWVCGNGSKGFVSVKIKSPHHISHGYLERIVPTDFTGWRYFAAVETDNGEIPEARAGRPDCGYDEFREPPDLKRIGEVSVEFLGDTGEVRLRDIRALPARALSYRGVELQSAGGTLTFDGELKSGQYAEYEPGAESAPVYNERGETVGCFAARGALVLAEGENRVAVRFGGPGMLRVTALTDGPEVGQAI